MTSTALHLELLKFLSKQYPTIDSASTEIMNLQAILNLPKGTEHFVSDVHGEYEVFSHVIRNASGVLKLKVDELFMHELSKEERRNLCTLIYYPEQKIELVQKQDTDMNEWYRLTLLRLIKLCKQVSSKYTRSKVRKALPKQFAYIMEELLSENMDVPNKEKYYDEIIQTIVSLHKAEEFICAFCYLIQRLAIDKLHILGDIFDRGPKAAQLMETIMSYHNVDIQWGNHDMLWMGAAAGSAACIANVIRMCLKYNNLATLEDGYGINLMPLATFAMEHYTDTCCDRFLPTVETCKEDPKKTETKLIAMMHKAITLIQFKLEAAIIDRNPNFKMEERKLLHQMNLKEGTFEKDGNIYPLLDTDFPCLDPQNPYTLTEDEQRVLSRLIRSFTNSSRLQEHVKFLFLKGSLYKVANNNLLYHGCMVLEENGDFSEVEIDGQLYSGKNYLDKLEEIVRDSYFLATFDESKQKGQDWMWYLWCGSYSPLFGKDRICTFERYFVEERTLRIEKKNPYYTLIERKDIAEKILTHFQIPLEDGHIISGHVPVQIKKGESPIKADGKVILIDGGFTKAYQNITGIAGYTLIFNSFGLQLATHRPFQGVEKVLTSTEDLVSTMNVVEVTPTRKRVRDTDTGKEIENQIQVLLSLVKHYQLGLLKEN